MNYLKAELHCHSCYSKGEKIAVEGLHSPTELVQQASRLGLDVLALTDHDCFQGVKEAVKAGKKLDLLVIPGEEIKTGSGHLIGLGLQQEIKPGKNLEETIDEIHGQGGIAIAPHPFDLKNEGIGFKALACDATETFNSLNLDRLSNRKAKKFVLKNDLNAIVGSDAHFKEMVGLATNKINCEKDLAAVLKAIRKGKLEALKCNYVKPPLISQWAVQRLKKSNQQVQAYINTNYWLPKRLLCRNLLKLVNYSPGKIDYFFKGLGYFGLSLALVYASLKNLT